MTKGTRISLLLLIIAAAFSMRIYGIDWDAGQHLHPDERYMTMVATGIQWPTSITQYFDVGTSPLSPYNHEFGSYIYGTVPLFLVKGAATLLKMDSYASLHLVGRALSTCFDIGTIICLYFIGKRLLKTQVGLIAAALYAVTAFPIQQSHFFTVDPYATFFITLGIMWLVYLFKLTYKPKRIIWGFAGVSVIISLALATKLSTIVFVGAVGMIGLLLFIRDLKTEEHKKNVLVTYIIATGISAITCYLFFRLLDPYIFASNNWLNLSLQPDFQHSFEFQRLAIKGEIMYPPQYQWVKTIAYWFPLKNIVIWGTGVAFGVLSIIAAFYSIISGAKQIKSNTTAVFIGVLALWAVGVFIYQGGAFVKTMRYFLPLLPIFALSSAILLDTFIRKAAVVGRLVTTAVLAITVLWSIAYLSIYSRPTTRVEASHWLYAETQPTDVIANEHWDDPLPLLFPNEPQRRQGFQIEVYNPDLTTTNQVNNEKLLHLYKSLDQADYVVLSSPRAKESIGQLQKEYPLMNRYYRLLDSGELGFKKVAEITSFPSLFGIEIPDRSAEEAFWVYDHPPVEIYQKTQDFTYEDFYKKLVL